MIKKVMFLPIIVCEQLQKDKTMREISKLLTGHTSDNLNEGERSFTIVKQSQETGLLPTVKITQILCQFENRIYIIFHVHITYH